MCVPYYVLEVDDILALWVEAVNKINCHMKKMKDWDTLWSIAGI